MFAAELGHRKVRCKDQGCIYIKTEECALEIFAWKGKRPEDMERHTMRSFIFVLTLGIFSCSGKLLRVEPWPLAYSGLGRPQ